MWGRFRDCAHCGCRVLALFSLQCSCSHLCAQAGVCGCFQQLGICLDKAGCLNGTNEVRALVLQGTPVVSAVFAANLCTLLHHRTSATSTARPATATAARTSAFLLHACIGERATLLVAYPCLVCSGEMDGCGLRYPFTGKEVCECEDGYVHLLPSNCRAQPTHVFRTPIPLICDMVPISATLATTATRLPALCAPPAARATCARRAASLTARAHARPALSTSAIA